MSLAARLSLWGFDPPRLLFAFRTPLAACLALLVAWRLGLEHPQWSAMTVWAASQPVRGMLFEKALFRALGTIVGTLVGVGLMLGAGLHPAVLVVGLALWLGLCAWIGNLIRGFASYGVILSGYSAAMVALLATPHSEAILALGTDRFLTVMTGVFVALAVGWLFTAKAAEDALTGRMRRLTGRVLADMAARLADASPASSREAREILSEMAAIEEALDPHGAGSPRSRRASRTLRAILIAQTSALLWIRGSRAEPPDLALASTLAEAAEAARRAAPAEEIMALLTKARAQAADRADLAEVLAHLHTALSDRIGGVDDDAGFVPALHLVTLHRDWVGARQAFISAIGVMLGVGAVWLLTGWSGFAFVLLGASVMISLFSTHDNPASIMRHILVGQAFGVVGALVCRWWIWPLAHSDLELVLLMTPFILLGAPPIAHRRTLMGAFDYNLTMLLLLQPVFPLTGTFANSVLTALAVVSAPVIALIAFRTVYPADARRRMQTLITAMIHEIQYMAINADASSHREVWRSRLHHRLLRLTRWAEKAGEQEISAIDGGLAILRLGEAVLEMQALRRVPGLTRNARRSIDAALSRIGAMASHHERARRTLRLTAARLMAEAPARGRSLRDAHDGVAANAAFFYLKATP